MIELSPPRELQKNLTLEQFQKTDIYPAMGAIIDKLHQEPDWVPASSEAISLFCLQIRSWIESRARMMEIPAVSLPDYHGADDHDKSIFKQWMEKVEALLAPSDEGIEKSTIYSQEAEESIPWPDGSGHTSVDSWDFDSYKNFEPDEEIVLRDMRFESMEVIVEMLGRMSVDERGEFFIWYLDNLPAILENANNVSDDLYWVFSHIAKLIPLESRAAKAISVPLLRNILDLAPKMDGKYDDMQWELRFSQGSLLAFMVLGVGNLPISEREAFVIRRFMIREYKLADSLNAYRQALAVADQPEAQAKLKKELSHLMGLSEDAVQHTNLEGVYESIDFSQYYLSKESNDRVQNLAKAFEENGVAKSDPILTVASGTGWETHGLQEMGFTNCMGLDISDSNQKIARQLYADTHFVKGSWHDRLPGGQMFEQILTERRPELPPTVDDSKYKLPTRNKPEDQGVNIHCTGWSLPHCEDEAGLYKIITRMSYAQKNGDILIIDARNPLFGMTKQLIEKYRQVLTNNGFKPEDAATSYYIVDGPPDPDGVTRHFYNRFIPPIEWLIRTFEHTGGYKLIKRTDEELPTGHGDQSSMLVFRRVE